MRSASSRVPTAERTRTAPVTPRRAALEVGDQVLGVLDPHADPHQPVADAEGVALRLRVPAWVMVAGWEISVSTPPRVSASEQSLTACSRLGVLARAELEGDHGPEAARLPLVQLVPGMVGEPGPVDLLHLLLLARKVGQRRPFSSWRFMRTARVLMPRRTSQESNGERIAPAAFCRAATARRLVLRHDHAAHAVGVAVQELRGRVHDDVRAQLERPLEERAHERVVDDDQRAAAGARPRPGRRCRRSS